MPSIDDLMTKYCIDVDDMPLRDGVNVVQIRGFDSEEFQCKEGAQRVTKVRHLMYLVNFPLPLRLNNTRLQVIAAVLGSKQIEDWIGRKIGLVVQAENKYGKVELTLLVHASFVDQALPACGPKPRERLSNSASTRTPIPGASTPPPPAGSDEPIGKERAALIMWALAVRGKSWSDLTAYMRQHHALPSADGLEPFDAPFAVRAWAEQYCRAFPITRDVDRQRYVAERMTNWQPPPGPPAGSLPPPAAGAGTVVDRRTGEVVGGPPVDESDIPF